MKQPPRYWSKSMLDLLYCVFGGIIFPFVVFSLENIALNKTAWQSDVLYKSIAYRAVDGRKSSLTVYGPDCMTSDISKTVEWRVDLEEVVSIHHISIQFATNNEQWDENNTYTAYFLGFSVYLSNTTHKEDGIICFRDTNHTNDTIPNPINITCPHYGRYVIYYNNRTHPPYPDGYSDDLINALCEVEVYGCPSTGKYRKDCGKTCPNNCQDGRCHVETGLCFACIVGYIGPTCEGKSYISWANEEIQTQYILGFGCAALGVIILFCSALLVLTRSLTPGKVSPSYRNESEERTALQDMPTQGMQVRLEDYWSNLNINTYSEPSELNEEMETANYYSKAQFPCSFGDHDSELNVYSYNHLHETPLQSIADAYEVVKAVF